MRPRTVLQLAAKVKPLNKVVNIGSENAVVHMGFIKHHAPQSRGEDVFEDTPTEDWSAEEVQKLLSYDFEGNDTKYEKLEKELLENLQADEKVVIFAFYRPTLAYLRRRLTASGISVAMIHGGIVHKQRWEELDRFRDPKGPRVLLSSEVGSEGIDLQFCRVIVNYDLP